MSLKSALKKTLRKSRVLDGAMRRWFGRRRTVTLDGVSITVGDVSWSLSHSAILREFLADVYGLGQITFDPGDVVIDIGAHVGVESVYLGKRYPWLRILAFEPVPDNFENLKENLAANSVGNVEVFPLAVTSDGRDVEIWVDLDENSGGGGHDRPESHFRGRRAFNSRSVTLDQIFADHQITRCKLLKIDCEGAEHEILLSSECLGRVDYLSGEFHVDDHLRSQGHSIDGLIAHCALRIPPDRLRIVRDEH